jgi:hypothetical protein
MMKFAITSPDTLLLSKDSLPGKTSRKQQLMISFIGLLAVAAVMAVYLMIQETSAQLATAAL